MDMDQTIVEESSEDETQIQDLNMPPDATWTNSQENVANNNSTLLYIAVEYVKSYKSGNDEDSSTHPMCQDSFTDFVTPQVSPLDPNMSSVARYSPVPVQYQEDSNTQFGPVVIHQLITQNESTNSDRFVNNIVNNITTDTSLDGISTEMPTVLCSNDLKTVDSQYLEMVNENNVDICNDEALQLVPESDQQEVELLITDQATGISYSVNAQELLVERCLDDDQQLLEALAPDPILESDLLALDDSTLKSELNTNIIDSTVVTSVNEEVVNNYINCLANKRRLDSGNAEFKMTTRSSCQNELHPDEQLLSCVYSIMDKPILSRARASLPESYLSIGKVNEENGVFAKKTIPKRTQFGPLEGAFIQQQATSLKEEDKTINFFIKIKGSIYIMDVSDECTANWMCFVRKAARFEEQNLLISQEENGIFFTTTKNILPKEELMVGYSSSYAEEFNLIVLKPTENNTWTCYECPEKFSTSDELQKHFNVHDEERDENIKPKKKYKKKLLVLKKSQIDIVECNICQEPFFSNVNYNILKNHLVDKHQCAEAKIGEYFSIHPNFECNYCNTRFRMEMLLNIHKLEHDPELSLEQANHVCPQCQRKFPTRRQLVLHVTNHALSKRAVTEARVNCPICYKIFSHRDRLQKHMLVHGSEDNKPLQCKTCKKRFMTSSALACHIKTHLIGKKTFECPICNEGFDHVLKLKLHVPKHAHNNQYNCPYCGKIFNKYSLIRKHIRAFHSKPKHNCTHCSKMFPTQDNLKKHMLRHSDHREFLCSDCGKQFKRKDKLREHCKKIHPEDKKIFEESSRRKKFTPKVEPTEFHRFIYKCHSCLVGFKRRGMLVNHLAKRHPDVRPDSVPELNLPILQTTRDYYCQYCEKVYKSSSKRKMHILKNHPGAALPVNNRQTSGLPEGGLPTPSFSQTVGSVTTRPKSCQWCHKQYASRAKLLQHVRKEHPSKVTELESMLKNDLEIENIPESSKKLEKTSNIAQNKDDTNSTEKINKVSTDGTITSITSNGLDVFSLDDDSRYCHLSIDENEIIHGSELNSHNTHLYNLLTANNGMMPPR